MEIVTRHSMKMPPRTNRSGSKADMCSAKADVRFGSKADMCVAKSDVRFTPESRHVQCKHECPLWAKSGHVQRQNDVRFCRPHEQRNATLSRGGTAPSRGASMKVATALLASIISVALPAAAARAVDAPSAVGLSGE